ncbi:MAG: YHS domain-containing protein [Arenicella sp.]|jgi:YHS domain-containing protein
MKNFTTILLITISTTFFAQEYNLKKGYVAEGYDVVSYFSNTAEKGDTAYTAVFEGVKFKFVSKQNLEIFKSTPKKYRPAYGGFCAYAVGAKAERVSINPETFEIRAGKLYLFYNAWGTNTFKMWQEEGAEQLKEKADKNWVKIKKEK